MSIVTAKQIIKRTQVKIADLMEKYKRNSFITDELDKLTKQLHNFEIYLDGIDQLKPNYNTNEITAYMQAVMLHIDLLKERMAKKDFLILQNRIKLLKTILKFHPTRYTTFAFITAWFYELIFFI